MFSELKSCDIIKYLTKKKVIIIEKYADKYIETLKLGEIYE